MADGGKVVALPDWRADLPAGAIVADSREPLPLASLYLTRRKYLRRWREQFYDWTGSRYHAPGDESITADVYRFLELVHIRSIDDNGKTKVEPLAVRNRLVREVLAALPSRGILVDGVAPQWMIGGDHPHPRDLLPVANGLLHLPTAELLPATPDYFAVAASPIAWDPTAPAPAVWLEFLDDLWRNDRESIETLQEWMGYVLTSDTRQHKALLIVGPKRSGKGTIGRAAAALVGADNVTSPTLAGLGGNFGLSPLLDKLLAIIADARLSGRSDQAVIAERLLSITGEDLQTVDRKFLPAVTCQLCARFMIMTNELPRLADMSGALASRFVVLILEQSFYGREDHDLGERLRAELPGILRWSVTGYQRLRARGRFVQPASAAEAVQELEELGSPVAAFVADRCVVGPAFAVARDALYKAWRSWCEERGREQPGTAESFGRDLRAAVASLKPTRPRAEDGTRRRYYEGIGLVHADGPDCGRGGE